MSKHFIFDFETIGADVLVCPVVDMAYTTFEWSRFTENPYTFEELVPEVQSVKLSVSDQMQNLNCKFKKADVHWWENLPKIARDKIIPSDDVYYSKNNSIRKTKLRVSSYIGKIFHKKKNTIKKRVENE
mgnify:CR=1 FL=1